jgi:hypothetical protein
MEKLNLSQGDVVLIQRHDPDKWIPQVDTLDDTSNYYPSDDDEESGDATVGVVWSMDRIEPNGTRSCAQVNVVVRMSALLRKSAGLKLSAHVILLPYRAPINEAEEVSLQEEDNAEAPAEREALRFFLREELRSVYCDI